MEEDYIDDSAWPGACSFRQDSFPNYQGKKQ